MAPAQQLGASNQHRLPILVLYSVGVAELCYHAFGTLFSVVEGDDFGKLTIRIEVFLLSLGLLSLAVARGETPFDQDAPARKDEAPPGRSSRLRTPAARPAGRCGQSARASEPTAGDEALDSERRLRAANGTLHAAALKGDAQEAERLFEAMVKRGVEPDIISYNSVIDACAKAWDHLRAEEWIKRMADAGVAPDVVSYTGVIHACSKQATKDGAARAEQWLEWMIAAGVRPNSHSFSAAISASAKANDVDSAVRLLDKMEDTGEDGNVFVYTSVLDACARVADASLAIGILTRMRDAGVEPNIYSYAAAARALASQGDYAGVEKLQYEMEQDGVESNAHFVCALIWAYGNSATPKPILARQAVKAAISKGIPIAGNKAIYKALVMTCSKGAAAAIVFYGAEDPKGSSS